MSEHELKRKRGGQNELGWIQPACSCGWVGNKHYAYDDYQHSNCRDEEQRHLLFAKKEGASA